MRKILDLFRGAVARAALALLVAATLATGAAAAPAPGKVFVTPEAAAEALVAAARVADPKAVLAVLGGSAARLVESGDKVADARTYRAFAADYDKKHSLEKRAEDRVVIVVGDNDFPFAIPLRREAVGWRFDPVEGREEIINRRIGRNELSTIETLQAIVDAQLEYAAVPRGPGPRHYASRFLSSPGKHDGLYWPIKADQSESPLGPLVGRATGEGYHHATAGGQPAPYHGYLFKILSGQGANAPGGAYDYRVKGRLVGGFAVVAWPASYGGSGVQTFIVSHDGVVWQKNLGPETAKLAGGMTKYDPDATWTKP